MSHKVLPAPAYGMLLVCSFSLESKNLGGIV